MGYTFLLRDIPALAYSSNLAAPCSCVFQILYSESLKQASISLSIQTHICGFEEPQPFELAYNADNWKTVGLSTATRDLDEGHLATIRRRNTPAARTLSLSLHSSCPVRCPPSSGSIAPKPGHETSFAQLRDLASTAEVDIVFDIHYLRSENCLAFFQLISHPYKLTGVPAEKYRGPLSRQTDWTVFSPAEDATSDAPPSYVAVPAKRPRQGKCCCFCLQYPGTDPRIATNGSSPCSPSSKRERRLVSPVPFPPLSPTESAAAPSLSFLEGSPTEKATTVTASPSPQPLSPHHQDTSGLEIAHLVKTTIEAVLPGAMQKVRAWGPFSLSSLSWPR